MIEQHQMKYDQDTLVSGLYDVLNNGITKGAGKSLNGLSITSYTGDIHDGFGFSLRLRGDDHYDLRHARETKVYHWMEYNKPTSLYDSIFGKINDDFIDMGLNPSRMRISLLKSGSTIPKHNDAITDSQYCYKMHIPIMTGNGCYFMVNDERYEMLDIGSVYLFNANSEHYVVNDSDVDRYHLVCDVYDVVGNFTMGKCHNLSYHQKCARTWRDYVDGKSENYKLRIL